VSAFGNFRDAVIVMINVPFAASGGVIALHLAGETLSISAFFGFLCFIIYAIDSAYHLIYRVRGGVNTPPSYAP
jgi:cobalt-zinc-cadmium resistance protein CzcA